MHEFHRDIVTSNKAPISHPSKSSKTPWITHSLSALLSPLFLSSLLHNTQSNDPINSQHLNHTTNPFNTCLSFGAAPTVSSRPCSVKSSLTSLYKASKPVFNQGDSGWYPFIAWLSETSLAKTGSVVVVVVMVVDQPGVPGQILGSSTSSIEELFDGRKNLVLLRCDILDLYWCWIWLLRCL